MYQSKQKLGRFEFLCRFALLFNIASICFGLDLCPETLALITAKAPRLVRLLQQRGLKTLSSDPFFSKISTAIATNTDRNVISYYGQDHFIKMRLTSTPKKLEIQIKEFGRNDTPFGSRPNQFDTGFLKLIASIAQGVSDRVERLKPNETLVVELAGQRVVSPVLKKMLPELGFELLPFEDIELFRVLGVGATLTALGVFFVPDSPIPQSIITAGGLLSVKGLGKGIIKAEPKNYRLSLEFGKE